MSAIAHAHTYTCTTHICVLPKTNSRYKFRQSNILSTKFSLLILLLFWCAHYSFISFSLIHYNSQLHCSIDTFISPHIEQIIVTLYRQIFTTQRSFHTHKKKSIQKDGSILFLFVIRFLQIRFVSIHEQVSSDCWCSNFSIACSVWLTVSNTYWAIVELHPTKVQGHKKGIIKEEEKEKR